MRRIYWYEASVAALLIVLIIWMAIPSFKRAQIKSQTESMQDYVENVIQFCSESDDPDLLTDLRGSVFPTLMGPITLKDGSKINRWLKQDNYLIDKDAFLSKFNSVETPQWNISDVVFVFQICRQLKSTEYRNEQVVESDSAYNPMPCAIAIKACVGDKEKRPQWLMEDSIISVGVKESYLDVRGGGTPYDSSNGLTSYGEFYADTTSIWPKKKAVIMDPPPKDAQ